jgi:pyridoxamine 5'-phosphate oxidase
MDLGQIRREYQSGPLRRADLDADPLRQFETWFRQAMESRLSDPSAMSLATAGRDLQVSLRTVLLKRFDARGFVFYTNYESTKARQIAENPRVALLFPWLDLNRQVKITGLAERVSRAESLKYFLSRPRGSQLGAWVSAQSRPIRSRDALLGKLGEIRQRFADGDISLPEFWGGYRVRPLTIEFWQGRPDRLHDRFRYRRPGIDDETWKIERLAP